MSAFVIYELFSFFRQEWAQPLRCDCIPNDNCQKEFPTDQTGQSQKTSAVRLIKAA